MHPELFFLLNSDNCCFKSNNKENNTYILISTWKTPAKSNENDQTRPGMIFKTCPQIDQHPFPER